MKKPRPFLLCLLLAGCAATEKFPEGKDYMVRSETDYFRLGPAQPGRAEKLPPQTFVQVLQRDSGYSYVKLEDGRTGYVASMDIAPAPPTGRAVPFDPEPMEIVEPPLPDFSQAPEEVPVM